MKRSLVRSVKIPKIVDDCLLYFTQHPTHMPFVIRRAYFIMDANTTLSRGFHAHRKTKQVMFCIKGSIRLIFDDGVRKEEVTIDSPESGIFIDKMIWHEMHDFQKDTILLVLASHPFDPTDYIRDYQTFLNLIKK